MPPIVQNQTFHQNFFLTCHANDDQLHGCFFLSKSCWDRHAREVPAIKCTSPRSNLVLRLVGEVVTRDCMAICSTLDNATSAVSFGNDV